MRTTIVIPVYNEGDNICSALSAIRRDVRGDYTVSIVYDREDDTTLPALDRWEKENGKMVRRIRNRYGRGALNAIRTGMETADSEYVIVTMADLSDPPEVMNDMLEAAEREHADIVCASRYMKGGRQIGGPLLKGLMSRCAGLSLHALTGLPTHDPTNSFKLYRKSFLDKTTIESTGGFELGLELVVKAWKAGFKVVEVPTSWHDRANGKSNFKLWKWLPHYLRWYFLAIGFFIGNASAGSPAESGKRGPASFFTAVWKNKYTIWIILLLMAVNAYVMMQLYNPGWYPGSSYILNHYLLSYELAFMPRSLAGTVYQAMLNFMSPKTFFLLFLFFQLFLYLMLTLYFHRCISRNGFSAGGDFLFLTYLLLPSTYLAFFDFGRLDLLLLALAFAAVLLIRSHRHCAIVLIPGIITAGVLIHEVFWFYYVPTIFAWSVFYAGRNDKKSFLLPGSVVFGCLVSLCLFFLMRKNMPGGSEIMSFMADQNQLSRTSDNILSFSMYAGDGVKAKSYLDHFHEVFFTPSAVMQKDLKASLSAFAVCIILPVWIFKKLFDAGNDRQEKWKTVLLFLASLSPLGLCVIAFDFGRWCTAAMWCVFLTLFSLISVYSDRKISIPPVLMIFQIILLAVMAMGKCTELCFWRF